MSGFAAVLRWLVGKLVSFFEESPGVMSSTRLIGITLTAFAGVVVAVIVWYVHRGQPDAGVILALNGSIAALIGGGAVAIFRRGGGE